MAKKKIEHPKILLIQVSGAPDNYWGFYPPLGLASIATHAIKYGNLPKKNILILDSNLPFFKQIIKSFKPDIIGFSTFSNNYLNTIEIAKELKQFFHKALFIVGGIHISIFPETLDSVFKLGVLKEGEDTFLEILNNWKKISRTKSDDEIYIDIKGIVFKNGKKIIKTHEREMISPLDKIPSIDWSLFLPIFFRREIIKDNESGVWKDHKVFPLFTSRGCPYQCVFCARSALWKTVRYFSEQRVAEDIEILKNKFGVTGIQIWDDLFTISVPRLKLIEKQLKKRHLLGKILFYRVFARSDLFTPEMAKQLKKINVKSVAFGLESGSERILQYLKKNTIKVKNNFRAVELCEKEKIGFVACMMMGIPTETNKDMDDTLKFVKYIYTKKTLEFIDMARATPFPGTELYDYAIQQNLLSKSFSKLSNSLSLNNMENDRPLLIKDEQVIKSYQNHWRIIKDYENKLWLKTIKQKGYKWSMIKLSTINQINKKLFLPTIFLDQAKKRNFNFFINFGVLVINKIKKYAKKK